MTNDKYHWIAIVLDPLIVQFPKPVKGFVQSLNPLSTKKMTSYHTGQLVKISKETIITKSGLFKLINKKYDSKKYFIVYDLISFSLNISISCWQLYKCRKKLFDGYRR